eukprot:GFYU01001896.1.p1 GENE.GFYU01001896.1~~GFYU01001896.1.p1  ORF type:complete len:413 (-),score=110.41 GFYU01001896.1:440-1678(-)
MKSLLLALVVVVLGLCATHATAGTVYDPETFDLKFSFMQNSVQVGAGARGNEVDDAAPEAPAEEESAVASADGEVSNGDSANVLANLVRVRPGESRRHHRRSAQANEPQAQANGPVTQPGPKEVVKETVSETKYIDRTKPVTVTKPVQQPAPPAQTKVETKTVAGGGNGSGGAGAPPKPSAPPPQQKISRPPAPPPPRVSGAGLGSGSGSGNKKMMKCQNYTPWVVCKELLRYWRCGKFDVVDDDPTTSLNPASNMTQYCVQLRPLMPDIEVKCHKMVQRITQYFVTEETARVNGDGTPEDGSPSKDADDDDVQTEKNKQSNLKSQPAWTPESGQLPPSYLSGTCQYTDTRGHIHDHTPCPEGLICLKIAPPPDRCDAGDDPQRCHCQLPADGQAIEMASFGAFDVPKFQIC